MEEYDDDLQSDMVVLGAIGDGVKASFNWFWVTLTASLNLIRSLLSITFAVIFLVALGFLGVLIAHGHAPAQETIENWRRNYAAPIWRTTVRPIVNLFRIFINGIQCTFYGLSWWAYGLFNDHLLPALYNTDVRPLAQAALNLFTVVFEDALLDYFIQFKFFTEPLDFTRIFDAWIEFWTQYQALVCYYCESLCTLWSVQPVINPIPFITTFGVWGANLAAKGIIQLYSFFATVLGGMAPDVEEPEIELPVNVWDIPIVGWPINLFAFLGSDTLKDPETLCVFANTFNGLNALFRVFSRLISQAILEQTVDRPEFTEAIEYFCRAVTCFVRSCENAFQRVIDVYVPIDFQFENFLCIIDTVVCWALYSVDVILTILINIDRVVTYSGGGDGNTFYRDVIKPRVAFVINLIGEPDKTDCDDRSCCNVNLPLQPEFADLNCYWMDPTDDRTLMWDPIRNQPRKRISECLCIFIERLLCDPMNTGTCFSESIVGDFSFCCLTTAVLDMVADLLAGLFEITLNFSDIDAIFRYIDRQKFLYFFKVNIVQIIDCIFSVLSLIPTVGECLRVIFVRLFALIVCLAEIILRYIVALFSLPYFVLNDESSFVLDPARGVQEEWEAILDGFGDPENPTSLINCLAFVINWGIPIPPIPCMDCEPQGYIQPPNDINIAGELSSPGSFAGIMRLVKDDPEFAFYGRLDGLRRLTPIRRYEGETAVPWELKDMILRNAPYLGGIVTKGLQQVETKADAARIRVGLRPRGKPIFIVDDNGERIGGVDTTGRLASSSNSTTRSVESGLSPTKPPLTGCTPTPPCFDLACSFRASAKIISFDLAWFGRIWNGLLQGANDSPQWDYFKGGGIEQDITMAIRLLLEPVVCACDLINLVLPVTQFGDRPNFCCFFVRLADLVSCILQTTINAIKSLALGSEEGFTYFKLGDFEKDLDVNFDITLDIVICACNLLRAIFPFAETWGFDICCWPEVFAATFIEVARGIIITILNFAQLGTPRGQAYFQLENPLSDDIAQLPIVVRAEAIVNAFFGVDIPALNEAQENFMNNDSGAFNLPATYEPVCGQPAGGFPFCICNLLDTIIPARPHPELPVANDNCPFINLCCFWTEYYGFVAGAWRFSIRLVATLWQPWQEADDGRKQPTVFFNFLICDEKANPGDAEYTATCGKLDPVLDAATGFLAVCPCEILIFVDYFIQLIFEDWDCLCGNGIPTRPPPTEDPESGYTFSFPPPNFDVGIVPRLGFLVRAVAEVILQTLLRRIPNPAFWEDRATVSNEISDEFPQKSLVTVFFLPITDAICRLFVALGCPLDAFLFWIDCSFIRERLFASIIAWTLEFFIRALELIEGVALFFASFGPDDVEDVNDDGITTGGDGNQVGNTVDSQALTAAILNIALFPLDLLFADSFVDLPASRDSVPLAQCPEGKPVDGWILAGFRYLACILGPLGVIFAPVIFLISYLWQLLGAVIYFFVTLILLIFKLLFSVSGDCGCYQCNGDSSDDWIDDPTQLSPPQPAKSGDCQGTCEHTSKRGALCYTPCLRNILRGEFDVDPGEFDFTDGPGGNLFTCRRDTGQGEDENVSNCRGYGFSPLPLCSAANVLTQFFEVVKAFFAIFSGGIETTDPFPTARSPPVKMDTQKPIWNRYAGEPTARQRFSAKVKAWKQSRAYVQPQKLQQRALIPIPDDLSYNSTLMDNGEPVTVAEIVFDAMYGMDFLDCIHNVTECLCEHFHLPVEDLDCQHTDLSNVTTDQVTMAMSHMIHNTMRDGEKRMAACEDLICSCENQFWTDIPYERRFEYISCVEKRAQGERMHEILGDKFPQDFYYRIDGPSILAHTAFGALQTSLHHNARINARQERLVVKQRAREAERRAVHSRYFDWRLRNKGYPRDYDSMVLPYMKRLDRLEQDLRSGRVTRIFKRARRNVELGDWYFDDQWQAVKMFGHSTLHLTRTVMRAPIKRLVLSTWDSVGTIARSVERWRGMEGSTIGWIQDRFMENARKDTPKKRTAQRKIDQLMVGVRASPIYRWWYMGSNSTTTNAERKKSTKPQGIDRFIQHMRNVVDYHRKNHEKVGWSFYNLDRKLATIRHEFVKQWSLNRDTPNKRANRQVLRDLTRSVAAKIWPDSYPNHEEKFLFDSNCIVADGVLQTTEKVFGYCVNEFLMNFDNRTTRNDMFPDGGYHQQPNLYYPKLTEEQRQMHPIQRPWRRPKVNMTRIVENRKRVRFTDMNIKSSKQWRKLIMHHPRGIFGAAAAAQPSSTLRQSGLDSGPTAWQGRFSLATWLICLFEDVSSTTVSMQIADFIVDVREWFEETNLDPTAGDVGAAYWVRFLYTCDWPNSINCSMGVGLSQAIYDVSFWFVIVFIVLSILFPATLLPVIAFGLIGLYIIVVLVYAYRWSPRCLFLTPTPFFGIFSSVDEDMQIPGASAVASFSQGVPTGANIPFLSYVAPPVLPQCLPDDLFGLFNSWFAQCGDFIENTRWEFLLPDYMINGDRCPPQGEPIDVASCADVGMGDGLTNTLYLIYWLWPSACEYAMRLEQSCYADYFPSSIVYLTSVLNSFKDIPQTQRDRLTWCFWVTSPSIGLVLAFVLVVFTVAVIAANVIAATIRLLYVFFIAIPLACCNPCRRRVRRFPTSYEDDDDDDDDDDAFIKQRLRPRGYIASFMRSNFGYRPRKQKME